MYLKLSTNLIYKAMNPTYLLKTRLSAILCCLFITTAVFAQKESVIYIGTNGKLTTLEHAIYIQKIFVKSPQVTTVQTFGLKDSKWGKFYTEKYKKLNDSTFQIKGNGENTKGTIFRTFVRQTDESFKFRDVVKDKIVRIGSSKSVVPLLLHGQVIEFYPEGNKKSVSEYRDNELVSNQNWNENGDKYIDNIFYSADTDPTFNPGIKVLHQHILKGFKDAGIDISAISGSMIIGFVVMENGTIDGIKIIKSLGPNINSVACESFATLKGTWTPAKLNNQMVRYFQVFPINFIYKENHLEFAELRGAILHFQTY
jgi:hypothetical protein